MIRSKRDFSGLDDFLQEADLDISLTMAEVAHNAIAYAKEHGTYKNHTHNLRSAPGTAVVRDNKIVDLFVPSETGHAEAKSKTENMIIYGATLPKDGIIIADGMEYASFVESKGFDVISGAALNAEKEAKHKFNNK